jgi:hypothetical protein
VSDKLAGNQIPKTVRGLNSPLTLPETRSPITQPFGLDTRRFQRELVDHVLIVTNSNRRVGCLMRIDPKIIVITMPFS